MSTSVLRVTGVQKQYSGLRPLRLAELDLRVGERIALSGFDAAGAELLVNLLTGASLPDQGTVETFGRATSEITDGEAWIASLDRFGIVSGRAVLLESATVRQNLALPLTLNIDELDPVTRRRVDALAAECGIEAGLLERPVGDLARHVRVLVHLARALALDPQLLLVEHPTADVEERWRTPVGRTMGGVLEGRRVATLFITQDVEFAEAAAHRSLAVEPATGAVREWKRKRGWFR